MTDGGRTDSVSRVILATPRTLFRTFMDKESLAAWRAPEASPSQILDFEPRIGGGYRMLLNQRGEDGAAQGKSLAWADEVSFTFLEMLPEERVIEAVTFASDEPAVQGPMTLTTLFEPMREGTKVILRADNVPARIAAEDHREAMLSALRNLARLTE